MLKPDGTPVPTTFCFHIRRDLFDLPSLVIGACPRLFVLPGMNMTLTILSRSVNRPVASAAIASTLIFWISLYFPTIRVSNQPQCSRVLFLIFCSPVHFRKRVWEGVFLTVYYNNWCCWQKCESCHHLQTVSSGMYRAKVNMSTTGKRTRIQGAEIAVETKSLSNSSRCVAIL